MPAKRVGCDLVRDLRASYRPRARRLRAEEAGKLPLLHIHFVSSDPYGYATAKRDVS